VIWVYFRLPEPRGRTYGELDMLFEQKVSARKFAGTKVDPFGHRIGARTENEKPGKEFVE
jgi:SP family general alpha glucoside:H+ symporter-like MFS transporter